MTDEHSTWNDESPAPFDDDDYETYGDDDWLDDEGYIDDDPFYADEDW